MSIVECVPNFSEGRRRDVIEEISDAAVVQGAELLDCESDADHNRMVLTIVGCPSSIVNSALSASAKAVQLIDMRKHKGVHPRIGAVDVVPFVPLGSTTMEECKALANKFAKEFAVKFSVPVYLYGEAAKRADRRKLSNIRVGQFEALEKLIGVDRTRDPDYGPNRIHPTAGATAVGARQILIAYNVDLDTNDIEIAKNIAKRIRQKDGGMPGVQALGLRLEKRGVVQVSTNLTDYKKTSLYSVFNEVSREAKELGVEVVDSEIIGMVPRDALPTTGLDSLKLLNFSSEKVIEDRLTKLQSARK